MKDYDIIGYSIDGGVYCIDCTTKVPSRCKCKKDENGMCSENCSGNGPNPIFAGDEVVENCEDCGMLLAE